jgi:hypothetical protein
MDARPPSNYPELYLPFSNLPKFGAVVEIEFYQDKDLDRKEGNSNAFSLAKRTFQSLFDSIDDDEEPQFVIRKISKSGRPSLQRAKVFEITAKLIQGGEGAKCETLFSKLKSKAWPTEQVLQMLAVGLFVSVQKRLLGSWRDVESKADLARWLHISRAVCAEGKLGCSLYQAPFRADLLEWAADELWKGMDGADSGFELVKGALTVVKKTVDVKVSDGNGNLALLQYKLMADGRVLEGGTGGALQGSCDFKGKIFTGEPASLLQLLRHSGRHCGLHLSWLSSSKVLTCPPERVRKLLAAVAAAVAAAAAVPSACRHSHSHPSSPTRSSP